MAVRFLFFGQTSKSMGVRSIDLTVAGGTRLMDTVKNAVELKALRSELKGLQVSVNREFSDFNAILNDGDEVAFLPPFSGG